jgi:ABC-type sulfate/molybdate transport systems ATPase subunit
MPWDGDLLDNRWRWYLRRTYLTFKASERREVVVIAHDQEIGVEEEVYARFDVV